VKWRPGKAASSFATISERPHRPMAAGTGQDIRNFGKTRRRRRSGRPTGRCKRTCIRRSCIQRPCRVLRAPSPRTPSRPWASVVAGSGIGFSVSSSSASISPLFFFPSVPSVCRNSSMQEAELRWVWERGHAPGPRDSWGKKEPSDRTVSGKQRKRPR
jgi:hypothetical protein